jgi:hypothetical protein
MHTGPRRGPGCQDTVSRGARKLGGRSAGVGGDCLIRHEPLAAAVPQVENVPMAGSGIPPARPDEHVRRELLALQARHRGTATTALHATIQRVHQLLDLLPDRLGGGYRRGSPRRLARTGPSSSKSATASRAASARPSRTAAASSSTTGTIAAHRASVSCHSRASRSTPSASARASSSSAAAAPSDLSPVTARRVGSAGGRVPRRPDRPRRRMHRGPRRGVRCRPDGPLPPNSPP